MTEDEFIFWEKAFLAVFPACEAKNVSSIYTAEYNAKIAAERAEAAVVVWREKRKTIKKNDEGPYR